MPVTRHGRQPRSNGGGATKPEARRHFAIHDRRIEQVPAKNIPELKPLTWYWYDREKGEVVGIRESRKPPREGLALVVTNIYDDIVDNDLRARGATQPSPVKSGVA
jgi:hypothetical protein